MTVALSLVGCVPQWKRARHDRQFQRVASPRLHKMPATNRDVNWWDHALRSTVSPLGRALSPARYVHWLFGGRESLDVNAFGEVPDSPWFTNRAGRQQPSATDVLRGPNEHAAPASGPLRVISGKPAGVTPGFVVSDTEGVVWFVKFDPPAFVEMTTGAEIVSDRLLYAAGYHVPEMYLVDLDLARLKLTPTARTRDEYNRSVPFTGTRLRDLLIQLNPSSHGHLRALFSRSVPGRQVGSFGFSGVRTDDPNDRIAHDRRRSLRGLWVFSAWLNNTDTRRQNTLDTFIPVAPDGKGYVRHYLLDFGDSLGATGSGEKDASEGYENRINWVDMGKNLLSLGLRYPYWLRARRSPYRSVGPFESDIFDPGKWQPRYPNPAFTAASKRDTFWAASILARLGPEQILAAVSAAKFSQAGATDWVYRALRVRRKKLLRHAFAEMLALVDARIADDYRVKMSDLEVDAGLWTANEGYRWSVSWNRSGARDVRLGSGRADRPTVDLRKAVRAVMTSHSREFAKEPYLTLRIWRPRDGKRGPSVRVHLRVVGDHLLPVGIERELADR